MRRGSGRRASSCGRGSVGPDSTGRHGRRTGDETGDAEGVVMAVLTDVVDVENEDDAEKADDAEPDLRSRVLLDPRRANMSLNPEALGVGESIE
jgi:hypothetical protein